MQVPENDIAGRALACARADPAPGRALLRQGRATAFHALLIAAGPMLACGPALAQFPLLPDSVGPGSLPSVRAAAASERLAGEGQPQAASPAGTPSPAGGPEIRLGGFGFPQAGSSARSGLAETMGEARRAFSFTPSLGLQMLGTDNLFQTVRQPRADLVTTITPGLLLNADTLWLQAVLNYAPNVHIYARSDDQNRFDQLGNGQALVTLVPGLFYLDLRGASSVQSVTGGIAPESGLVTNRQNRVTTTAAQVSPYILQRFGTLATLLAGYSFHYVDQSGSVAGLGSAAGLGGGLPASAAQQFTAHEAFAVLRSGADFGRLAWEARADSTNYIGDGVLDGAYRRQASVEGRYAILRGISVLAEGGYEQQRYAGTPGVLIDDPIWALGGRLDFADDGRIIAKYGRRDGFASPYLEASIPIGGRTRLAATYTERLTTSAQRATDLLRSSSIDALGNAIDLATGQPTVRSFANSFLSAQGSLLRVRAATVSLVQTWPRDTIVMSLIQEERTPISTGIGGVGFAEQGTSGSLVWARALTERTTATAYVQYGQFTTGQLGNGELVSGSVTLSHRLSPRALVALQFGSSSRTTGTVSDRATQNIALLSLRQTF